MKKKWKEKSKYLIIPIIKKKQSNPNNNMIAFDPGIKTFQTGFDSNSNYVEYGKGDFKRLFRLTLQIDKLTSKVDTHHKENYSSQKEYRKYKSQRRKMRRTIGYLRRKMMNLKKDFHWKIARHITLNNKHIMISRFQFHMSKMHLLHST